MTVRGMAGIKHAPLTMDNFRETADKTRSSGFGMVEKDYDYLDVDFEDENLKIEKEKQVFILSIHNPSSQIWLSSPISGAHHFKFVNNSNEWIGTRDKNLNLIEMLQKELDSLK